MRDHPTRAQRPLTTTSGHQSRVPPGQVRALASATERPRQHTTTQHTNETVDTCSGGVKELTHTDHCDCD